MPQQSPYEYYLELLGKWPTGIALASQWLVHINFDGVNGLMSNLGNIIKNKENSSWDIHQDITNKLIDGSLQYSTGNMTGCVFARQIGLPGETINASNAGLEYGGYMAPATSDTRSKYEPLSITVLETNASFLDFVIRPWTIMVGYNGLVARAPGSPKYVKAPYIDVIMYAKTDTNLQIRKIYRFHNVAPINIGGETYSYTEEGLRYTDVKFVYDRYTIQDGVKENGRSLINLP